MKSMSASRTGVGPEGSDTASWASETLPLSVRKELLERELSKLGFRRAASHGGGLPHESPASQQQGSASSHPQAHSGEPSDHPD